jgi:hypothetical protein
LAVINILLDLQEVCHRGTLKHMDMYRYN